MRHHFLYSSGDYYLGKRFVDREFKVRVRLIIFQIDVIARLMFFSERCFKYQRLDFVVRDNELNVRYLS